MQTNRNAASDHDLQQLTAMFRLLTDKTRLNILMILCAGERNVSSLCEMLNLPQPTVSHHLGLLRISNLIANRREGKQVFYGLNGCIDTLTSSFSISMQNYQVRIDRCDAGDASAPGETVVDHLAAERQAHVPDPQALPV
jgi:DNA-binding transcriptional ArsR family regulator